MISCIENWKKCSFNETISKTRSNDLVSSNMGWYKMFLFNGRAVLDGIDLDIEDHNSGGYSQLVRSLRSLMKTDSSKNYLITGAPQCPYPDASLGPEPGMFTHKASNRGKDSYAFQRIKRNHSFFKPKEKAFNTWFNSDVNYFGQVVEWCWPKFDLDKKCRTEIVCCWSYFTPNILS